VAAQPNPDSENTSDGLAAIVQADGVSRRYGEGQAAVDALADVSVEFPRGRFAAIMGPSGSGKSTLMHILAGLDRPTAGTVKLDGVQLTGLDDRRLTKLRRDRVGFIFQTFNLLPVLSAEENILLPLSIAGRKPDREWLSRLIDTIGIRDRLRHRPAEMSGGQQQRVAVARALVSRPAVVFADEPTGNLDSKASGDVLDLLRHAVDDFGQTVVMVTHDQHAASFADRVLVLADGRIVEDGRVLGIDRPAQAAGGPGEPAREPGDGRVEGGAGAASRLGDVGA
jgi:putative ABC transport system ATP-binding protein